MRIVDIKLKVSKEQEKAILLKYPDIKFFLEKMIFNTAEEISGIAKQNDFDLELEEYHKRQTLNKNVGRIPGQPYWKGRRHTQATKDKISESARKKIK